jgi:hypothetical protein
LSYCIQQIVFDGSPMTFRQRQTERKEAYQQEKELAKQEAANAPPPAPPERIPFVHRQQQRRNEERGQAIAEEKARQEATANAPVKNPYRERARELEDKLYQPATRKRHELMLKKAQRWDEERQSQQEAAERQAAIDANPEVRTAREYSAGLLKLAPPEFAAEAAECNGIAQAGDASLAWTRMRDLEQRIWQHQDRIAAEKLATKSVTDAEFQRAAAAADAARERAALSASQVPEPSE